MCKTDNSDGESKTDNSDGESKNHPVATNFQFLKILATSGLLLVVACGDPSPAGNEYGNLKSISFV